MSEITGQFIVRHISYLVTQSGIPEQITQEITGILVLPGMDWGMSK